MQQIVEVKIMKSLENKVIKIDSHHFMFMRLMCAFYNRPRKSETVFICSNKWHFNGQNIFISFPVFYSLLFTFFKSDRWPWLGFMISWYNLSLASKKITSKKLISIFRKLVEYIIIRSAIISVIVFPSTSDRPYKNRNEEWN